jgi:hypothetical protein
MEERLSAEVWKKDAFLELKILLEGIKPSGLGGY